MKVISKLLFVRMAIVLQAAAIAFSLGCRSPIDTSTLKTRKLAPVPDRYFLCQIHYHAPPEHGAAGPGTVIGGRTYAYGKPECDAARGYMPPAPDAAELDQNGEPIIPALNRPVQINDWIEIHYVYSSGVRDEEDCPKMPALDPVKNELGCCRDPLKVVAVWAKVVGNGEANPGTKVDLDHIDKDTRIPLNNGKRYRGRSTGASKGARAVSWQIPEECFEIEMDDLGRIHPDPTRPILR